MPIRPSSPNLGKDRPRWRTWLRRLGVALVLLALAEALRYGINHHFVTSKLRSAIEELDRDDPGWRLEDIEAARAAVPDEENSARYVVAVAALLPKRWPDLKLDALDGVEPNERLSGPLFADLVRELDRGRAALEEARKLQQRPRGRHRIEYKRNVLDTILDDQEKVRVVTRLLVDDARRHAQTGESKAALRSCRAALNAARSLGDEPFAVSQLVRLACVLVACTAVERTLAQGEPPADEMLALQSLLEDEDRHPGLRILTRGERAMIHALFDALESGDVRPSQLVDQNAAPSFLERLTGHIGRDRVRRDHPHVLALMTARLAGTELPTREQAADERAWTAEVQALRPSVPLSRLMPPIVKLGEACRRKQAGVRCLAVALAAECYRQRHGKWPGTLAVLVDAGLLGAVPLDPFDGQPLRYRRVADGVIAYSVGADETDNGGTLDRKLPARPGADIGYRLWDVPARAAPARPSPREAP